MTLLVCWLGTGGRGVHSLHILLLDWQLSAFSLVLKFVTAGSVCLFNNFK